MTIQLPFESQLPGIEVFCERLSASLDDPPDVTVVEVDLWECPVETIEVEDMIATAGPWSSSPTV